MNRDKHGRFISKWTKRFFVLSFIGIMAWAICAEYWVGKQLNATNSFTLAPLALAAETPESKIAQNFAKTKDELVESLAKACETKNAKEPDAVIILDTNNQMSIGAFQYQIKTVQQYYHDLLGQSISRVDAIQIAIDHNKAAALTKKILFEVPGGWQNWRNCAEQLDLPVQIQLLNSIEQ